MQPANESYIYLRVKARKAQSENAAIDGQLVACSAEDVRMEKTPRILGLKAFTPKPCDGTLNR